MPAFSLRSPAFADGDRIPARHTCEGIDVSPGLLWSGEPSGTRSLVLLVEDPDAPRGVFSHWLAWGIPAGVGALAEGARAPVEGRNDFGSLGWRGPCPPRSHGVHRYVFALSALDGVPDLPEGSDRRSLERALAGSVIATATLVGTYSRPRPG